MGHDISGLNATASAAGSPFDTHATPTGGTTASGARDTIAAGPATDSVAVLSVEWNRVIERDLAVVKVDGATYRLPLSEDRDAPTGHGGGSAPTWWVDDQLTTDAHDEAIGHLYDKIGSLVCDYMTEREAV